MKQKQSLFFSFAIMLMVAVFTIVGCGDPEGGPSGSNPQTATYSGTASNGDTYKLEITENINRAAYVPVTGDNYKLILVMSNKTSTGTIEISPDGVTLTLTPSNNSGTITVTISGSGITTITAGGSVYWDNNTSFTAPGALNPASGDYTFPYTSNNEYSSYWNKDAPSGDEDPEIRIYLTFNPESFIVIDEDAFSDKFDSGSFIYDSDDSSFPPVAKSGFTVTVNDQQKPIRYIYVSTELRIDVDCDSITSSDVVKVKYDKPTGVDEQYQLPLKKSNTPQGALESFAFTAIPYSD